MQRQIDWFRSQGLLKGAPTIEDMIDKRTVVALPNRYFAGPWTGLPIRTLLRRAGPADPKNRDFLRPIGAGGGLPTPFFPEGKKEST